MTDQRTSFAVDRVAAYLARIASPDDERIDRDDIDEPSVTFGDIRALLALARTPPPSEVSEAAIYDLIRFGLYHDHAITDGAHDKACKRVTAKIIAALNQPEQET